MIIKLFELQKNKKNETTLNLLYGNNQGLKNQIINDYFISNFKGDILKYEEDDVLNNHNEFISNLLNRSLFENEKILIISRATDKVLDVVLEILERNIQGTKIILESNILEKKSKLRVLFEKDKNLVCIPVYEDDNKSLEFIIQDFLKKKKIKFSQEIINILIDRAKGDRGNLKNELSKLESLSLSKKNINLEDVQKLTNLAENYTVFELSDNYLAKNSKKVSRILNENNYNSDDCILILRTILNKSKRLLKLKNEIDKNNNIDLVLSSFKPPIFWKDKEIVKEQIVNWPLKKIQDMIIKISEVELLIKKNSSNSLNILSDFIISQANRSNN